MAFFEAMELSRLWFPYWGGEPGMIIGSHLTPEKDLSFSLFFSLSLSSEFILLTFSLLAFIWSFHLLTIIRISSHMSGTVVGKHRPVHNAMGMHGIPER